LCHCVAVEFFFFSETSASHRGSAETGRKIREKKAAKLPQVFLRLLLRWFSMETATLAINDQPTCFESSRNYQGIDEMGDTHYILGATAF
jgi:hypothetical protein